jgi:aminoglycoside N3'-acetyltransferase
MEPFLASDKEKYPLLLAVVNNTSDHYAEHRATIEKVLKA